MSQTSVVFDSAAIAAIKVLADAAKGSIRHLYNGCCPDEVEGGSVRDEDCPVCQALIAVDQFNLKGNA